MALPLVSGMDIMASGTLLALGSDVRAFAANLRSAATLDRALEAARRSGLYNFVALISPRVRLGRG